MLGVMGILSILLLGFTLFGHGHIYKEEMTDEASFGVQALYSISTIILVFVSLGAFGIWKEKKWPLILFAVGMILGCLYMLAEEIFVLAMQATIAKDLRRQYLSVLPLENATESVKSDLDETQREFQCCGIDQGYMDWHNEIPESCLCAEDSNNLCVPAPRHSELFRHRMDGKPVMIYSKPCIQYLIEHDMSLIQTIIGTMLGVTLLWVSSVVLCIIILCQMSQKKETLTVVYSKEAKAGNYCNLVEGPDVDIT